MKTYAVTIRATVTKTLNIEAETEHEAVQQAHEEFTTVFDGSDEDYTEDMVNVEELK